MSETKSRPMVKTNHVNTTTDYFLFKSIDGNRTINLLHLNRLKKSMSENYLFTIIIVNEKYEIIDGQHRFECIKELGLPLNYIICHGYGLHEVHVLNANAKTWSTDEYLDGYCKLGYIDYLMYRDFKSRFGFGHNECFQLLGGSSNGDTTKYFWQGKFKIKDLPEAERKAELISLIEPFYSGYNRRSFVYTMISLFNNKNFEYSEFIAKLKQQPSALQDCPTVSSYLTLIEEIYNYRRRVKVNLRFYNKDAGNNAGQNN